MQPASIVRHSEPGRLRPEASHKARETKLCVNKCEQSDDILVFTGSDAKCLSSHSLDTGNRILRIRFIAVWSVLCECNEQ